MRPYGPVLGLLLSRGGKVAWSRICATLSWWVGVQFCCFGVVEGMCRTSQLKCVWGDSSGGGVQSLFDAHLLYERRKP